MVNHKYNFVDPDNNELHTNNIESSWREGKLKFKEMYGVAAGIFKVISMNLCGDIIIA